MEQQLPPQEILAGFEHVRRPFYRKRRRRKRPMAIRFEILVVVILFAVINVIAYPVFELVTPKAGHADDILIAIWIGLAVSQVALIFTWWVFAPVPSVIRCAWAIFAVLLAGGAYLLGHYLGTRDDPQDQRQLYEFWIVGRLSLPLMVIIAQAPLWLVRVWFGWRIEHKESIDAPADRRPLQIRDAMFVIGITAAALAVARVAPRLYLMEVSRFLAGLAMIACAVAFFSVTAVLPSLWAGLRLPTRATRYAIAMGIPFVVVLGALAIVSVAASQSMAKAEAFGYYSIVVLTFVTVTTLCFWRCRRRGFVLRWENE